MEENNKTGLYIVAIVAIIAIVALIIMTIGGSRSAKLSTASTLEDSAGQAFRVERDEMMLEDDYSEVEPLVQGEDPVSGVCGNGILEDGEQCDMKQLGGYTCQDFGYIGGTLGCKSDCTFDLKSCTYSNGTYTSCELGAVYSSVYRNYDLVSFHSNMGFYVSRDFDVTLSNGAFSDTISNDIYCGYGGKQFTLISNAPGSNHLNSLLFVSDWIQGTPIDCFIFSEARYADERCALADQFYLNNFGGTFPDLEYGTGLVYDDLSDTYYMHIKASDYSNRICSVYLNVHAYSDQGYINETYSNYWQIYPCRSKISYLVPLGFGNMPGVGAYSVSLGVESTLSTYASGYYEVEQNSNPVSIEGKQYLALRATNGTVNTQTSIENFVLDKGNFKKIPEPRTVRTE